MLKGRGGRVRNSFQRVGIPAVKFVADLRHAPSLTDKSLTDVIVIGAGITGLATAWNYKQQAPGRTVRIVDRVAAEASPL